MIVNGYKLPDDPLKRVEILRKDLFAFLATCVWTEDPANPFEAVRPAPARRPYLKYLCDVWGKSDKIIIEKSRRIWISWFMVAAHLHLAFTKPQRNVFCISQGEAFAKELIKKSAFMYKNIPDEVWPKALRPTMTETVESLRFKEMGSMMYSVPSGSDKLRSYTASALFFDEFAFMPECVDAFTASRMTVQGGGRITIASTNPVLYNEHDHFFWQLMDDRVNNEAPFKEYGQLVEGHKKEAALKVNSEYPDSTGWRIWQNMVNGFTAIQLHYTADPEKRDPDWARMESQDVPTEKWNIEMELSRRTFGGTAVYGMEFNPDLHIASGLEAVPGAPIYRGWDFGTNQSTAICQYVSGQLRVLAELPNGGTSTRMFAPKVLDFCLAKFGPDYRYIDIIDPSGFHAGRNDATGKSNAEVMREFGMHPIPGPSQDPDKRIDSVLKFLMSSANGQPSFQVDVNCGMLIAGFKGSYQYPLKEYATQKPRPVKNEFSHIHDCLQYVATYLKGTYGYSGDYDFILNRLASLPGEDDFAF